MLNICGVERMNSLKNFAIIFSCLFVTILNGASVIGNGKRQEKLFGDNLKEFLEELRARMHMDMTDTLGIPRLDPFSINYFRIHPEDTILGIDLTITDLVAVGLKTFEIKQADVFPNFVLDLFVPTIKLTGNYNVYGEVGGLFLLHGKGPFNIVLHDIEVNITALLHIGSNIIVEPNIILDFSKIDVNLEGFMGGGALNEFFNQMLSDMIPVLFEEFWPEYKPSADNLIGNIVNQALDGLSLTDLIGIITGGGKDLWPEIEPIEEK